MRTSSKKFYCVLLGGGGHARVLIDCLLSSGYKASSLTILDTKKSLWGKEVLGVKVAGGEDKLPQLIKRGVKHFAISVGSVGDAGLRRKLYEKALSLGLKPLSITHPSVICSPRAKLGMAVQLLPGSIVNAGSVIGNNVIVNSGAIVEHDCVIGDHVHIATGAKLCSAVKVGALAHVGAGAVVRQGIEIDERAMIGAGAAVVKNVPAGVTVMGVPAKAI